MSYRSIFGQDLSDYEIEVIIDNPAVRTWWAQSKAREAVLQRWQHDRSMRGTMMNILKTGSKIASVSAAIYSALTANRERHADIDERGVRRIRQERDPRRQSKSFHILPCGEKVT